MAILYLFIAEKISRKQRIPAGVSFILLAIIWLWFQNYWLVASLFLLAFLDLMSGKKTVLLFFQDKIEIRGFPKKIIHWNELNNAILKDHILTLDLKNDHLIQGEIAAESFVIDENDFNLFCLQQLQNKT